MQPDSLEMTQFNLPDPTSDAPGREVEKIKLPHRLLEGLFAFAPNRETLGATAYFIVEKAGNILVDCPNWNQVNQDFLQSHGGVHTLILTHRGGIGKKIKQMQDFLSCEVLIQEQEAYLLPEVQINSFAKELNLSSNCSIIWTPGHSPGSSCVYWREQGGILFSGRHLVPDQNGNLVPLKTAKTFHWRRQLRSVERLRDRFNPQTLTYLCPGANTGFLRGKGLIDNAYQYLSRSTQSFNLTSQEITI